MSKNINREFKGKAFGKKNYYFSHVMAASTQTLKPLTLHAHVSGPNPYKIAIALETLLIPYDVRLWEFGDDPVKGVKGKAFLAINENGRLPALEGPNTGVVSWESGAVMNYLLRVYDKKNMIGPRGQSEQDRVDFEKWILFLLTGLGPMLGQCNWYRHYNTTTNEDAYQRYVGQVYRHFDVLEAQLKQSDGKAILPGGFCAVDIHFYPWVWEYGVAGVSLDKYPLIEKWFNNVAEMEAVKAAYEKVPRGKSA
jgi:glutathione S-transferase